ncbi:DNA cytosine methyltransferase [Salmonella enterica]|nr:DNA cytosine methyltransferase [Salmonella enterica]EAO0118504.1 DNA cytosine methyltransferase [Salmonella enterica]EAO3601609.1 DNA cytosine methyltransferase [Salmonella enterica]EAR6391502.1 DNA cytosine methyltransferase [Salmonella enterica]EAV1285266.1 DNA cytosine methyltransferase [Salmonella enterica]
MRFGSVCSGIEAASVAWNPLGMKAAWFSEIEPFPCRLLEARWPTIDNVGNMLTIAQKIRDGILEAPDVLVGGTPCQSFSISGLRGSMTDPRGALTLAFVDIANAIDEQRQRQGKRPCFIIWENVPGVLSTPDNAFGCFLGGLVGETDPLVLPWETWSNAGYVRGPRRQLAWQRYDAGIFGLQQRRHRVFLCASANADFDPCAVLPEPESCQRALESFTKRQKRLSVPIDGGTLFRFRRTDSYVADGVSSTLSARDYKDARDLVVTPEGRVRGLCPEEYELLQGFPVDHTYFPGASFSARVKALGNSMPVPVMRWIGKRLLAEASQ